MENDNGLAKLQLCEKNILRAFICACEKCGLKYYLIYGSCLGAVRHKDIIPWDDDIDVAMPREDYEKFMATGQQYLPEYYFLQNYNTDPEYLGCFAKIRDSRTSFIESGVKTRKMNHGVYIDIFPIDYYPRMNIKKFKLLLFLYKARLSAEFSSAASAKMRIVQFFAKIIFPNLDKTRRRLNALVSNTQKSDLTVIAFGTSLDESTIPAVWYGNGAKAQFGDIEVIIPEDYDKFLTKVYGDYMTPPPVTNRTGHSTNIIDTEKPYTEYMK